MAVLASGALGLATGQRRVDHFVQQLPKDDLATKLLQAEVEGHKLADMEFLLFFLLLVDAGGDTTRNLLSAGVMAMLAEPEKLA